jgi:hypothetical protein
MLFSVLTKVFHVAGGSKKFMLDLTSVKLPDQQFVSSYILRKLVIHLSLSYKDKVL